MSLTGIAIGLVIIMWLSLAYFVGRDSERRGHPNGFGWVLLVLVTGIYGTVLYLLVRNPHPDSPSEELTQ